MTTLSPSQASAMSPAAVLTAARSTETAAIDLAVQAAAGIGRGYACGKMY